MEGGRKNSPTPSAGAFLPSLLHTPTSLPPQARNYPRLAAVTKWEIVLGKKEEKRGERRRKRKEFTPLQQRRRPNELSRIQEVTGETSLLRAKKEGFSRRNTWYSEAFFPPCAVRETYECMCVKCSVKTTASFSSQWSPPPPPPPPSVGK